MCGMIAWCLSLVIVALMLALPLTWWLLRLGTRWGLTDNPDSPTPGITPGNKWEGEAPAEPPSVAGTGRKWHDRPTPNIGGSAILLAVALPMLVGLGLVWLWPTGKLPEGHWLGAITPHLAGLRQQTPMALALLAGAMAIHVLGIIDDRRRLGPYTKLAIELGVAAALVVFFDLRLFTFLGQGYAAAAAAVLSILWMGFCINAMNFLDNMDGLSAGVGAVIAALYLAATLIGAQWFVAALAALLLGALLGFLWFNFPPARIFMGDGGSLLLGFWLGAISIRTTSFAPNTMALRPGASATPGHWYGVLMPAIVMAVPLYDLVSVSLIRMCHGKSPFVGDRNHFSHRLVRLGLSPRAAVLVIWLGTAATGLGGVMLGTLRGWQATLVAGQTLATLATLALLERSAPRNSGSGVGRG
jgi:UDP-GlcNAc:undecaprenyl-phosphate GlcNAc-1-phosphate transferase